MQFNLQPPEVKKGFAVTALILGIFAVLSGWVPFAGIVLGLLAIVFGVVSLSKKQPKGFGLTGLVLGSIGTVTSVIATVLLFLQASALINAFDQLEFSDEDQATTLTEGDTHEDLEKDFKADDDSETGGNGDEAKNLEESEKVAPGNNFSDSVFGIHPGNAQWDELKTANAPLSNNSGTEDDPHKIGSRVVGNGFEVVVNYVNTDAEEEVLALEPANPKPEAGKRYALIHITIKSTGDGPFDTDKIRLHYATKGQLYNTRRNVIPAPVQPSIFGKQINGDVSGYHTFVTKDTDGVAIWLDPEPGNLEARQIITFD